ncbi:Fosmidomycin resistance protein [Desulfurella amilsii]|uniref:Fosmidomycin resistance protein n=1 Tax=Desulfurella amilsii TaxID=1562698 RepID=A0A1X4XVX2_9BACT|nr:MFS transporter [Desulfurella amilsii]OSS41665.1 Fosmidomycin resistance protein [Desulfurella amilsii]
MPKPARTLLLVSLSHLVNDWYSLLIPPAIPLLKAVYHLSYVQSGVLVSTPYIVSAILQTYIAYMAEKKAKRVLALKLGFLILSLSFILFYFSDSFLFMVLSALIIGIGLSIYHPQGMGLLANVFKNQKGMALGINGIGGAIGFFLAPVSMGYLLSRFGLKAFLIVAIPGFLMVAILMLCKQEEKPLSITLKHAFSKELILVGFVAMVSPFFSRGISAFLPAYFYSKGQSILDANLMASVMLLAGIIAQPIGGKFSDKFGRKEVIFVSYTSMALFLVLFLLFPNLVLLFLLGFATSVSIPVRHALAAEVGGKSMNTNIAISYTMVMVGASIAPILIGFLIDNFGFNIAFGINTVIALGGAFLLFFVKPQDQALTN